jgi:hypothetical protein
VFPTLVLNAPAHRLKASCRMTRKPWLPALIFLGLSCVVGTAGAETEVAEFRGSESRNTPEFEVEAPWILDWRVSTDGDRDAAVDVALEAAGLGTHQGRVVMTKGPGNGVRLFERSGRFYFRVDSSLSRWTLRVVELSEEEAERYTPKQATALD